MKNTIFFLLVLIGCTTQKKATNYFNNHPDQLAPICADKFPVKDSLVTRDSVRFDTLFIEGDPVVLKDSFYIKGDTVVKVVTKECPKVQTIFKTVIRDSIHYVRDRAFEATLLNDIDKAKALLVECRAQIVSDANKIKHKNKVIWWLVIVVVAESLWIFRRPLLSLINPVKALIIIPIAIILLVGCSRKIVREKEPIFSSGMQLVGSVMVTKAQMAKFINAQEDSCKCKIKN
jgi:hypothetical protein